MRKIVLCCMLFQIACSDSNEFPCGENLQDKNGNCVVIQDPPTVDVDVNVDVTVEYPDASMNNPVADAGVQMDALPEDMGLPDMGMADSGHNADAGMTQDSGIQMDTGIMVDSGVEVDAGTPMMSGLLVRLSTNTPYSATVPGASDAVPFLTVELEAFGAIDINAMEFRLGGVGTLQNIDEVYLFEGTQRISSRRTMSRNRNVVFSSLGISMQRGEKRSVTLRASIASVANGGDTAFFELAAVNDIHSNTSNVIGLFPITGNIMVFSDTDAGSLSVDKFGSLPNLAINQDDGVIAKFNLEANFEDAFVQSITMNIDNARDHSDYKLWIYGTVISHGVLGRSDLVTFPINQLFYLQEGNNARLTVTADIGSTIGAQIRSAIEEPVDVIAIGGDFGFNLSIEQDYYDTTGVDCRDSGDDCSYVLVCLSAIDDCDPISSETVSIQITSNNQSHSLLQIDVQDQVLMGIEITPEHDMYLDEISFIIECVSGNDCDDDSNDDGGLLEDNRSPNFESFRLVDPNHHFLMGHQELSWHGDDDRQTISFNGPVFLIGGFPTQLFLVVDVANNTNAGFVGNVFQASFDVSSLQGESVDGHSIELDSSATSDILGNPMTIIESALDIQSTPLMNGFPASNVFPFSYQNAMGVDVASFSFEANEASGIMLSSLVISSIGENNYSGSVNSDDLPVRLRVDTCSLHDKLSGSLVAGPVQADSRDEFYFTGFYWLIPRGTQKEILVRCDFDNSPPRDGNDDAYAFFLNAAPSVDAYDDHNRNVTPTLGEDNDDGAVTTIVITN